MKCPRCGTPDTRVIDTRELHDGTKRYRRRECSDGHRFTTKERIWSSHAQDRLPAIRRLKEAVATVAALFIVAVAPSQTMQREPTSITLTSRVVAGDWLVIKRYNEKDSPDGFSPCYTAIRCSYKPVVRKVDGAWVIEFVSEIAQDLP